MSHRYLRQQEINQRRLDLIEADMREHGASTEAARARRLMPKLQLPFKTTLRLVRRNMTPPSTGEVTCQVLGASYDDLTTDETSLPSISAEVTHE